MAPGETGGTGKLQYDNEFWRFSLAVYGNDDVAQECLQLQQAFGIDINLLLFCAWLGARSVALSKTEIEAASGAVAAWHENVVRPLRGVRQHIKKLERSDLENYRAKVKGMELEAEQIEQAMLFDYSKKLKSSGVRADAIAQNIQLCIDMKSSVAGFSAPRLIDAARRVGA